MEALALSTFTRKDDNRPRTTSKTWSELVAWLQQVRATGCTVATCVGSECPHKNGPSWSPAVFAEGTTRKIANVVSVSVLSLDIDHVTDDQLADNRERLRGFRYALAATHSDRPGDRCVRVVVATSRPMTAAEQPKAWRAAVAKLGLAGVDQAPKDAARLFYLPSRPSDADYLFASEDGAVLDIDELLETATQPQLASIIPITSGGHGPGSRHDTLISMGGALKARGANSATIYAALSAFNAANCTPPKSDEHIREIVTYLEGKAAPHAIEHELTELGNGQRFAAMHGDVLRYCPARREWFAWDGSRWRRDQLGAPETAAKAVISDLFRQSAMCAVSAASGDMRAAELAEALAKFARSSSKASAIAAMIKLAQSEAPIVTAPDAFDRDPFLFNVDNGTIDLRTGELRPHRQSDMITMKASAAYHPTALCPLWDAVLARALPDESVRIWLQRYIGYALTGDVGEQVLAFPYGSGANGKSVAIDPLLTIFGDYGLRAAPDLVLARQGESHPTDQADLEGKRLVVCSEIEQGRAWAESTIKRITGDTTITARRMRQDFQTFKATHKLIVAANTKPKVRGTDHAIWRRMRLIPFTVTIPPAERDKALVFKLLAERDGILAWAVRGCLAWQREGLGEASAITVATDGYQADQDAIGQWIADECVLIEQAFTSGARLFESYKTWCRARGCEPEDWAAVRDDLIGRDGLSNERTNAARGIRGIGLRNIEHLEGGR